MKKNLFLFICILVVLSFSASALEVNRSELESAGNSDTIVFINYTGPQSVIQTIGQISGIGSSLGQRVSNSTETNTFGSEGRYQIIHAIDNLTKDKLDADILILGKNVTVDHIKNLRLIISSYLQSAYGYKAQDADTLAVFITVYNAVYRGNLDAYSSKYKNVVINYLQKDKVGLATNYEQWPGQTQIVIPLSDISGGLSTIDTSIISDKTVVESMRESDDKGVDERKNMVDIKEREADNATEKAQQAQKQATEAQKTAKQEEEKTQEQKAVLADKKEAADNAQQKAEEAQKKADENPNDKKAQQEAVKANIAAEEAQQEVEKQEEVTQKQEEKTQEAQQEAAELSQTAEAQQEAADKKRSEAQEDRKEIAKDQQEVIAEQKKNATVVNSTFGLKITDENQLLSTLVQVDADTGRVIKESPVTVIRNRIVFPVGENFIAIAGKTGGNATIKLVILDKTNLEIISESEQTIAESSVIVNNGNYYYAIIADGNNFTVGKFNADLSLATASKELVNSSTPIMISDKGISVTDVKGNLIILNSDSLTKKSE